MVGAGLQGQRRASALSCIANAKLTLIADTDVTRAQSLAKQYQCDATGDWRDVLDDSSTLVLVCTPTSSHSEICMAAMKTRKHVLCEKPLGKTLEEAERLVDASRRYRVNLKCGFNLRYHPAVAQAIHWKKEGKLGRLMFIKSTYGICGRENYEKDWRMNPKISGGGQLMDQGLHVLDLCRLFAGEFKEVNGWISTAFWDVDVEDNAFGLMRTQDLMVASFHASWTMWKNTFSFEVFGSDGAASIYGLGGSYGDERASFLKRSTDVEPFSEMSFEYRREDNSFQLELEEVIRRIATDVKPKYDGTDGLETQRLAVALYESARIGQTIKL